MKLSRDTLGLREVHPHIFECDASDVGLAPGVWPSTIETTLGNGLPLVKMYQHGTDEITHYTYAQTNGIIRVEIFND